MIYWRIIYFIALFEVKVNLGSKSNFLKIDWLNYDFN